MSHKKLKPYIVKVSVLGYFPLHSNDYNIDQIVEYFNNVINTLFISHVKSNINNKIKQVGESNLIRTFNNKCS